MAFWHVRKDLHSACSAIREELDDHLDAINANSRDAADVREALHVLDDKVEKLASRIDEIYLLLGAESKLSERECALQAFLQKPRTLDEVAAFCSESVACAERLLRTLHLKGLSVHSTPVYGVQHFTTNPESLKHMSLGHYF